MRHRFAGTALLTLAAVAALAGAPALAQQQQQQQQQQQPSPQVGQAVAIDLDALMDARLAGVRAGLDLTPEQAALFDPAAEAWRSVARTRAERREAMRADRQARMQERFGEGRGQERGRGMGPGSGPGTGPGMRPGDGTGPGQGMGRGDGPMMMTPGEMQGMRGPGAVDGLDFMERLARRAATASANAAEDGRPPQALRPFWGNLDADQQAQLPVPV
ncbi:MAG: hypothetical protein ACFE0R_17510, partial [Salinarimonas sp.]